MDFSKLPPAALGSLQNALRLQNVKMSDADVKSLGSRNLDITTHNAVQEAVRLLIAADPAFADLIAEQSKPQNQERLGQDSKPGKAPSSNFGYGELSGPDRERLTRMEGGLKEKAGALALEPDFDTRNKKHAFLVALTDADLAAKSMGVSDDAPGFQEMFEGAALKAGDAFRRAFDPAMGTKEEREPDYKWAQKQAGRYAWEAWTQTAHSNNISAPRIIEAATLDDVADLVERDLGLQLDFAQGEMLKLMEQSVPQDDYFRNAETKALPDMPARKGSSALDPTEFKFLNLGIRLANTTWKAGQVHRAAWEGTTDRVNPDKKLMYNALDLARLKLFDEAKSKAPAGVDADKFALSRVVFEIWKDVDQLKRASSELEHG